MSCRARRAKGAFLYRTSRLRLPVTVRLEACGMLSGNRCAVEQDVLVAIIRIQTEIAKLGLDLAGVIDLVVTELPAITNADGAIVEYLDGEQMVSRGVSGIGSALLGYRVEREGSLSGLSVSRGVILRSDDTDLDPRVDAKACQRAGIRSMVVAPLSYEGIHVGTLKIASAVANAFTERDTCILELMSELIAAAMYHSAKNQTKELYIRATHDVLTGLANRALFFDRLRQRISVGRRRSHMIGILSIDIDGLKEINDRWGHRFGDSAIRETADRISRIARSTDLVARLGGDEFGVMLDAVKERTSILVIAGRILQEVRMPYATSGIELSLSVSIGYASFPEDGTDIESLLEKADRSMYLAKYSSRSRPRRRLQQVKEAQREN